MIYSRGQNELMPGDAISQVFKFSNELNNFVLNSQNQSSGWVATGATAVTQSTIVDPKSGSIPPIGNSFLVSGNVPTDELRQTMSGTFNTLQGYVASCYVSEGSSSAVKFGFMSFGGANNQTNFIEINPTNGQVLSFNGQVSVQPLAIPIPNTNTLGGLTQTWYRLTVALSLLAGAHNLRVFINPATAVPNVAGDVNVFGFQVERGLYPGLAVPSYYLPTGDRQATAAEYMPGGYIPNSLVCKQTRLILSSPYNLSEADNGYVLVNQSGGALTYALSDIANYPNGFGFTILGVAGDNITSTAVNIRADANTAAVNNLLVPANKSFVNMAGTWIGCN